MSGSGKGDVEKKSESVDVKQGGLMGSVIIKRYWLVCLGLLVAALVGLSIGLYFIGEANGAGAATVLPPAALGTTQTPGPAGTANLGYRLPRNVLPVHYKLTLFPNIYASNPADFSFSGWEIITLDVLFPTDRIFLHSDSLQIDLASVQLFKNLPDDEEPLPLAGTSPSASKGDVALLGLIRHEQFSYNELVFERTLEVRQYKLKLAWTSRLLRDLYGLYYSSYVDSASNTPRYLVATQFEATYARKAFPCFDEPDMKAVFQSRLVYKADYKAISNNDVERNATVIIDGQSWPIALYLPTITMASYLNAYSVHQYEEVRRVDASNGRLYRFWSRREWVDRAQYIANITAPILNYFDQYYLTEYPFKKMDFLPVPDFSAGAMENWGLVTFIENSYYYNPLQDPFSQKERIASITAHELGHMDFGNIITTKWWDHLWINEGYASYLEYVGMPAVENWDFSQRMLISLVISAMRIDCTNATRPISQASASPSSIAAMFDTITYQKGGSLNRMMSAFLTEETFRKGLGAYLNAYKYSNTLPNNLFDTLTGQTILEGKKLDMNQIMNGWIYQAGYPELSARIQTSDTQTITIALSQTPFELDKGKFGARTWWIPIHAIVSTNPNVINPELKWLSTEQGTITLADSTIAAWNSSSWFILNANHNGFYRVNYDLENWQKLTNQLYNDHNVINALTRTQLIDDALSLARADYPVMTYSVALNLSLYLCHETSYAPWQATLDDINYVEQMYMQSTYDPLMKKYGRIIIDGVYKVLGWEGSDDEISTNHHLRTSVTSRACRWENTDCTTKATEYFKNWKQNPETYLPPTDTITAVRCYGIKYGTTEDWWWLYTRYTTTALQTDRNSFVNALGCSDNTTLTEWFLNVTLGNTNIPTQELYTIYAGVAANPKAQDMLKNFFFNNWRTLIFDAPTDAGPRRILENTFQYVNTQAELDELKRWKESAGDLKDAEIHYNNLIVIIVNNIEWMTAQGSEVGTWLTSFTNKPTLPAGCAVAA